jgi:PAS domain S-box-containing protein
MKDGGSHNNAVETGLADSGIKASVTFDTRGRIIYFDVTSEEIFGKLEGKGYIRTIRDIYACFNRKSRKIIRKTYWFTVKNPVSIMSGSKPLICMNKGGRSFSIHLTPITTPNNKIIAVTIYFEEVRAEPDQTASHISFGIRFVIDERLKNIINQFPAMVFYTAWGNDFCHMNSYACKALGYMSGTEPEGSWINLIHPDDRKHVLLEIQTALTEKKAIYQEYRVRRSDGIYTWIKVFSAPYCDMGDGITGLLGVAFNISEQKEAEASLKRYELLSKNTRDIILFIDSEGRIMDANKAAENTYGYSYDELCSMTLNDISEEWKYAVVQSEHENEAGVHYQTTHKCKDGSLINVEVSSQGADIGGRRLLLHIIRDITDRKKAEKESLRSYNLYRWLFMNINEGYVLCRIMSDDNDNIRNLKIIEANERLAEDLGVSCKTILNRNFSEVFPALSDNIIKYISENRQELKNGLCRHEEGFINYAPYILLSLSFYSPRENEIAMIFFAQRSGTGKAEKAYTDYESTENTDESTESTETNAYDMRQGINSSIRLKELELDLKLLEPAIRYNNLDTALYLLKNLSEAAKDITMDNASKYIKLMEQAVLSGNNQKALNILQEMEEDIIP